MRGNFLVREKSNVLTAGLGSFPIPRIWEGNDSFDRRRCKFGDGDFFGGENE